MFEEVTGLLHNTIPGELCGNEKTWRLKTQNLMNLIKIKTNTAMTVIIFGELNFDGT